MSFDQQIFIACDFIPILICTRLWLSLAKLCVFMFCIYHLSENIFHIFDLSVSWMPNRKQIESEIKCMCVCVRAREKVRQRKRIHYKNLFQVTILGQECMSSHRMALQQEWYDRFSTTLFAVELDPIVFTKLCRILYYYHFSGLIMQIRIERSHTNFYTYIVFLHTSILSHNNKRVHFIRFLTHIKI